MCLHTAVPELAVWRCEWMMADKCSELFNIVSEEYLCDFSARYIKMLMPLTADKTVVRSFGANSGFKVCLTVA